jgi:hypothetical protein
MHGFQIGTKCPILHAKQDQHQSHALQQPSRRCAQSDLQPAIGTQDTSVRAVSLQQIDARVLKSALLEASLGRVLAVNELLVLRLQGAALRLRVSATETLDADARQVPIDRTHLVQFGSQDRPLGRSLAAIDRRARAHQAGVQALLLWAWQKKRQCSRCFASLKPAGYT